MDMIDFITYCAISYIGGLLAGRYVVPVKRKEECI